MKDHGYTLLEILVVLFLLSIILLISIPNFTRSINNNDVNYFFEQLEKDLYSTQMKAISESLTLRFLFSNDTSKYTIVQGITPLEERQFPKGMIVEKGTLGLNDLRFLPVGTLSNSGSIFFYYKEDRYELIFQFVRGRFYIEKR
ncbi:competence type IV pilus minor pilin ComGD [Evansella sp. AB-rgal1]|uniref:competence type IV pilus minor pilin ComGD n=1 Tax=Evansella sp. AB-rgal1 TaxID=3242696 RepID=UPI00359DD56B